MIVIDIESSGMDPQKSSLLSVGAVDLDNPENRFYEECRVFEGAHIEDEALKVNGFTKEQATDSQKQTDGEVVEKFLVWLKTCKEWTLAGQNTSFDRDFMMHTAHRYHINWPLAHRTIDLHSIAYAHMIGRGFAIPLKNNHSALNLDAILKYTGINFERKQHNALEDALLEAEALSRLLYGKILLAEFAEQKTFPTLEK